ncbi:MAG: hypothetical protein NTX76_04480 [Alphaproteobacteria bacterium]|nr:hypothetical protein [Alphaproteobacteria bacterium]
MVIVVTVGNELINALSTLAASLILLCDLNDTFPFGLDYAISINNQLIVQALDGPIGLRPPRTGRHGERAERAWPSRKH